jgi:TRAP-type C4-dicarboxylate transport system permease small subunit
MVVALFLALLALSACQVLLRLIFHSGIPNAESMMRYLVMWVAFLGAALASYKGRHINLDVISRSLKQINKNLVKLIISVVSFVILVLLLKAGVEFIINEMSDSVYLFFIPVWILETIIPLMFFLMSMVNLQGIFDAAGAMIKEKKAK